MKKLITLAIIAGILTASLTSCLSKKGNNENTDSRTDSGIITTAQPTETQTPTPPTNNPSEMTYQDDNTVVYIKVKDAVLRDKTDTSKTTSIAIFSGKASDKLMRTGISTDTNKKWSRVRVGETEYYILSSSLTTDDLFAETFTNVTESTCYVYDSDGGNVNIRKYPSKEDAISAKLTALKTGTKVTLLSTSPTGWAKIRYDSNKEGYINSKYLNQNEPITLDTDFSAYFTNIAEKVMYVTVEKANLRKIPYSGNEIQGSIVTTLEKGAKVTVIAEGTVSNSKWYKVDWVEKGSNGAPDQHINGYIHAGSLAENSTASYTLEDYLRVYPALTRYSKTMYVSAKSLNARSTPAIEKDDKGNSINIVKSLDKKDQVSVVAIGQFDGTVWALVQDSKDTNHPFYFVSYAYLTTDPTGEPSPVTLTLESIKELYDFKPMTATGSVQTLANLYTTPEVSDDYKLAQLTASSSVEIVGSVTVNRNPWYVIHYNNEYCFISQTQVSVVA